MSATSLQEDIRRRDELIVYLRQQMTVLRREGRTRLADTIETHLVEVRRAREKLQTVSDRVETVTRQRREQRQAGA